MARPSVESEVTLSVLDRLIDRDPQVRSEAPGSRSQSVRQLKDSVRRDLEWILNTRRIAEPPHESLREVGRSVYAFGLQDFTAFSIASPKDQAKLLKSIQTAIRTYEPRIANLRMIDLSLPGKNSRTLRLRIEGLLLMDPAPEHVSFDTVLELASGQYGVEHAG
ncbi:MAG: type VI secretion system baseplate subunit TssE [Bryobacteraceae bacterium]|nr:type VI secretion system baseplate subunit TssE [Bryobacteraceae bacterium]